MYAGKRRTLRATIATIFSHETRDVSVFVKCDNIFRLFFLEITKNSNFQISQGTAAIYSMCGEKYYMRFVENLLLFTAVQEF